MRVSSASFRPMNQDGNRTVICSLSPSLACITGTKQVHLFVLWTFPFLLVPECQQRSSTGAGSLIGQRIKRLKSSSPGRTHFSALQPATWRTPRWRISPFGIEKRAGAPQWIANAIRDQRWRRLNVYYPNEVNLLRRSHWDGMISSRPKPSRLSVQRDSSGQLQLGTAKPWNGTWNDQGP